MTEEGGADRQGTGPDDAVVRCPWCEATDVERLSAFGPMHLTEQWFCRVCRSPFERVRPR